MQASEIRQKYLEFFKSKGHSVIRSGSLVPENDPTVLFTTAGMHPLVPYLIGEKHPSGNRLANAQKCIRTGDIDEVGDNTHLTFFEMLGNWSLGDYFKTEAIEWSFEFLTGKDWLNLPIEKLAVSVFEGDNDAPKDNESASIWEKLGIPKARIAYLPKKNNWWGPAGLTGPCGPDTEMFYWVSTDPAPDHFDTEDPRWVEIWNDVFMQYNKKEDGKFEVLAQQNVDTGMGLERITAVMNGVDNVYDTDLFIEAFEALEKLVVSNELKLDLKSQTTSKRIIIDHIKASTFIIGDSITPSNTDQGYVLRRLIRRAVRHGKKLGITNEFCAQIASCFIAKHGTEYPELEKHMDKILSEITNEEKQFKEALENGEKEFGKLLFRIDNKFKHTGVRDTHISGKDSFRLYDTYGFPIEMTIELANENSLQVDQEGFDNAFKEHQEKSRAGAEQKFAGGLADHSEESKKLHTATHLMLEALRRVLGNNVEQRGSNITQERLRFDFNYDEKLTDSQIQQVSDFVNEAIKENYAIGYIEMTVKQAQQIGATGIFEEKYENDLNGHVKVYFMGHGKASTNPKETQQGIENGDALPLKSDYFSVEICGGPHTDHTGNLKKFKITKEESSSKGIRRIKATIGN